MAALSLPTSAAPQRAGPGPKPPQTTIRCHPISANPCRRARRRQVLPTAASGSARRTSGSDSRHGAAVLILPGFLFSSRQYDQLVAALSAKGFHADVVPMSFADWLPVISGGTFAWYLQRADAALANLHARHGQVALVGHSAGGWIARILLGSEVYQGSRYGRSGWVHTLLTLGTPHRSIEAYPFGRAEESLTGANLEGAPASVTGSSLKFANHFYPTADSLGGVRVVCACGNAIRGRHLWSSSSSASSSSSSSSGDYNSDGRNASSSRWDAYFAFESYKANCGQGDVDGDGVTPLCIAHIPGAEQLVLPEVWHSPRRKAGQVWYGDGTVQEQWQGYLLNPQSSTLSSQ